MSDPTIFSNQNTEGNPPSTPATPQVNDPNANLLSMILNEQGQQKYSNIQEALKGAAHAQTYIASLQAKVKELEGQTAAASTAAARASELERTVQSLLERQNQNQPSTNTEAFSPDKIAELVAKTLDERTAQASAKTNQQQVANKLVEVFGADAEAKYNAAAQELGLTVVEMNQFAAKSPKAVLKALGVSDTPQQRQTTGAPATPAINTAAFTPHSESFVKRNAQPAGLGATTRQLQAEATNAAKMVEELHGQGIDVESLSDPKVFFKFFS